MPYIDINRASQEVAEVAAKLNILEQRIIQLRKSLPTLEQSREAVLNGGARLNTYDSYLAADQEQVKLKSKIEDELEGVLELTDQAKCTLSEKIEILNTLEALQALEDTDLDNILLAQIEVLRAEKIVEDLLDGGMPDNNELLKEARGNVSLKIEILRAAEADSKAKWDKKLELLNSLSRKAGSRFLDKAQEKMKAEEAAREAKERLALFISNGAPEDDEVLQKAKVMVKLRMIVLQRAIYELRIVGNKHPKNEDSILEIMKKRAEMAAAREAAEAAPLSVAEKARLQLEKSRLVIEEAEEGIAKSRATRQVEENHIAMEKANEGIAKSITDHHIEILEEYKKGFQDLCKIFYDNSNFTEDNQVEAFRFYTEAVPKLMDRIAHGKIKDPKVVKEEYATIQKTALADMGIDHSRTFTILSNTFLSALLLPLYYGFKNYMRGGNFFFVQRDSAAVRAFNAIGLANETLLINLTLEINSEVGIEADSFPPDLSQDRSRVQSVFSVDSEDSEDEEEEVDLPGLFRPF